MIQDGVGEGILKIVLHRLESRLKADDLDPILNRLAYIKRMIAELAGAIKPSFGPSDPPAAEPQGTLPKLVMVKSPQDQKREDMRAEFMLLLPDEKRRYASMAFEELKANGMATPTVCRKFSAGEWDGGIIFTNAVRSFVKNTYGPDSW
jgi:hypothetical protein